VGTPRERWGGIAQVTWQFLNALCDDPGLEVSCSAAGSISARVFASQFIQSSGLSAQWAGSDLLRVARGAAKRSQVHPGSLGNWLSVQGLRVLNRVSSPLAQSRLKTFDAYFSFFAGIPAVVRKSRVPAVGLFVHDVIPLLFPEYCRKVQSGILNRILSTVEASDVIVVNSKCTRRDVCDYLSCEQDRVRVISLAADPSVFYRDKRPEVLEQLQFRYGIDPGPYFLSLHSAAPHKNTRLLIQAYSRYRRCAPGEVPALVLAGGKDVNRQAIAGEFALSPQELDGVKWIGYVRESDLAALYSGASAFYFPSLYEGFGLPVLESMVCGTPAFVSNRGSLPELISTPGQVLDAEDLDQWSTAFMKGETIAKLEDVEISGLHARYSWRRSAKDLIELMRA